ncbi:lipocalin family protein [Thalassobacillus hwangdonensis]|uniref:Lipocalin family protein n=1 Tax=Thalassobacillus hwangdonensis TaxID=546108 RepID=A0ABW3L6I6_9BACI
MNEEVTKVSLPEDAGPHADANVEWWYFYTFLHSDRRNRYALMGSFFRVGELEPSWTKGHYLIYTLIDLETNKATHGSWMDKGLKRNMLAFYLPVYMMLNPKETDMWRLYGTMLKGDLPKPHSFMKKSTVYSDPVKLEYEKHNLVFLGEEQDNFELVLQDKAMNIELQFVPTKPITLVGGDGKPDDLYYYSFTRNRVQGKVNMGKGTEFVRGEGWFDHQWGKDYSLAKGRGWNWFGIQLDDGRELLLNEFRSQDGKTSAPMANLIRFDGKTVLSNNVEFEPRKYWKSIRTGAKYPVEWLIRLPDFSMKLYVQAIFPKQEMEILGPIRAIWEGACTVQGRETLRNGTKVALSGKGFSELVGYAKAR